MSLSANRPVHIAIRQLRVTGASSLDARRLADALPAALDRAMGRLADGGAATARPGPADRAADQIAHAIAQRLERRS